MAKIKMVEDYNNSDDAILIDKIGILPVSLFIKILVLVVMPRFWNSISKEATIPDSATIFQFDFLFDNELSTTVRFWLWFRIFLVVFAILLFFSVIVQWLSLPKHDKYYYFNRKTQSIDVITVKNKVVINKEFYNLFDGDELHIIKWYIRSRSTGYSKETRYTLKFRDNELDFYYNISKNTLLKFYSILTEYCTKNIQFKYFIKEEYSDKLAEYPLEEILKIIMVDRRSDQ